MPAASCSRVLLRTVSESALRLLLLIEQTSAQMKLRGEAGNKRRVPGVAIAVIVADRPDAPRHGVTREHPAGWAARTDLVRTYLILDLSLRFAIGSGLRGPPATSVAA